MRTELDRIRKETKEWLMPGEQTEFARKFEISTGLMSNVMTGRVSGRKYIEMLLQMHEKAMKNKALVASATTNGSTHE